jgi:predicted permease
LSLGIGMGTFVALVTLIRGLREPAPGVKVDGLVEVLVLPQGPLKAKAASWAVEYWSYPDFTELRHADTGMAVTGWAIGESQSHVQRPESASSVRVATMFVTANYFSTIGVSLVRGPGFDPLVDDAESTRGAEPRVVLGYDFWQNTLGSDPDIVGKTVTLDDVPHVVVGVVSDGYRGHLDADSVPQPQLFLPLTRHPRVRAEQSLRFNRNIDWVRILGRLSPGVGIGQANSSVSAIVSGLAERYPATNQFKAASVEPYWSRGARTRPQNKRIGTFMIGLSGIVLLIVCLNISGMMLVRGAMRERELSIRQAVGAGRPRLIQYLLSEALILAIVGGAISTFVLFGIPALGAWWLGQPVPREIDFDAVSMALSVGLCLVVSLLFGLLPAIRFSRPNLISALKDDAGGGGRTVGRVHRLAAAIQLGFAIPFLVMSGVLLDRTRSVDFGFETDGLLAARLDPAASQVRQRGGSREAGPGFFLRSVHHNLKQASGITSVTMADGMPMDFDRRNVRVGRPNKTEFVNAHTTRVAEGYLETIGARLLRGRSITAEDRAGAALVAVISEPLAIKLFPDRDAVGERLKFALEESQEQEFTIVGVSADFATSQLTTERPQILLPLSEEPASRVFLIVRGASGDENRLASVLTNAVHEFDPDFVLPRIVTGKELMRDSITDVIVESAAAAGTGSVVLVLAALGISGVIGFMVATRTREMAVRIALGATRPHVLVLMLRDVVKLVMPGVAFGLLATPFVIRAFTLPGFMVATPWVYVVAVTVAVSVALLAGLPAARRAASVQPMMAIRSE